MTAYKFLQFKYLILMLIGIIGWLACNHKDASEQNKQLNKQKIYNNTSVQQILKEHLKNIKNDSLENNLNAQLNNLNYHVYDAYRLNKFQPIWFTDDKVIKATTLLPIHIVSLYDEGIVLTDFPTSKILYIIEQVNNAIKNHTTIPADSLANWDIFLTAGYLKAAHLLLLGNHTDTSIANDTVFNGASYLVLKMTNSVEFPTFEAFRPAHSLYAIGLLQIKQGIALQKDTIYNKLYHQFQTSKSLSDAGKLLAYEITSSNIPVDENALPAIISQYQKIHHLHVTSAFNFETLQELSKTPAQQKEVILKNLELLRQHKQHITKDDYVWNP